MRNLTKSTVYERHLPLEDVQNLVIGRKKLPMNLTIQKYEPLTISASRGFFGSGEHNRKSECRTANHELSSACYSLGEDSEGGYPILHNIR